MAKIQKKISIHPKAYEILCELERKSIFSQSQIISIALLQPDLKKFLDVIPDVPQTVQNGTK